MSQPVPPVSAMADVLALTDRDGWLTPPLRTVVPPATAGTGRARTVQLDIAADGPGFAPLFDLLSSELGGEVIVIAGAREVPGAVWGEILSAAALQAGAVAALVDGAVRDTAALARGGLPVYARTTAVVGPNGQAHVRAVDAPVVIDGVCVATGDVIVFDTEGCLRVGLGGADAVLADARAYAAAEDDVLAALAAGERLNTAYTHKRDAVEQLRSGNRKTTTPGGGSSDPTADDKGEP